MAYLPLKRLITLAFSMHAFPTLQAIFWAFSMCTVGTHIAVDAFTLSRDHVAEPILSSQVQVSNL